jgi:putative transposase
MARVRNEEPGAIHHAFARGVNRRDLFLDEEDYRRYLRMLAQVVDRYGWVVLQFCLMPNHVHLLVETPEPNLGAGMQWLHSLYATTFNERHGRRGEGHAFQGPYGSKRVLDDPYLLRVVAYLAMNPVVAALCTEATDWPWSSFGLVARMRVPEWLAHKQLCDRVEAITGRSDFLSTIVL